jgi:hypothetical protein
MRIVEARMKMRILGITVLVSSLLSAGVGYHMGRRLSEPINARIIGKHLSVDNRKGESYDLCPLYDNFETGIWVACSPRDIYNLYNRKDDTNIRPRDNRTKREEKRYL